MVNKGLEVQNLGTAAAPSIAFTSNTSAGLFSPGVGLLGVATSGYEVARFDSSGNFGIGTSASGNAGEICWDSNYVYVCVAANTWRRAALSAW